MELALQNTFLDFVNITITAAWVIVAVLVLRAVLTRVPRKYVCLLWLVVLFRLLCPVSIETVLSVVPQPVTITYEDVAYTTPKIERTDAWAFDDAVTEYGPGGYDIIRYDYTEPIIPQHLQPNVINGGFNDGENRQLDRGHMLPSASRYSTWQANAQTFYATNIFPQNARLNQQNWAEVENNTRASICADTLYVVVGTLFENSTMFVSRGRAITRPSHCYKLLLRTRSGNTGKSIAQITNPDDIIAIGFLYKNSSEGNIEPAQAVVSIAEVEARSGIKFFPALSSQVANSVKNQKNIADWPAFK